MTDIVIRGLTEDEYLKLLRKKREEDYDTWKEFFLDRIDELEKK